MSVLGCILGVVGLLAALFAGLAGILGGIPAAVLGLAAVLLGIFAKKKTGKGLPAIVIGILVVILAVVMTTGSINGAKFQMEQIKAHPEKAPTVAKYIDNAKVEFGYIGLMMVSDDPALSTPLTEEVLALLKNEAPKTAETTEAPAEEATPAT